MTFVSYAQNFEDVLLWRALGNVPEGCYIDVGASHPDTDSVTRAFYDRGWRGINIEPMAASFLRLTAARPRDVNLQVAVGKAPGVMPFYVVEGADNGLSTLDETAASRYDELGLRSTTTPVKVDTLASICSRYAPPDIHFLKIDVEGAERAVIEGGDFSTYRPWIMLLEATAPMSTRETHAEWDELIVDAGYRFVWFDGLNRFYIAREHYDRLAKYFRTPPNVFDDFLRAADSEWTRALTRAETRVEELQNRAMAAETRVSVAQDTAEAAQTRALQAEIAALRHQVASARLQDETHRLRAALVSAEQSEQKLRERAELSERAGDDAREWLEAMRRSTSWRVTGPMRRALRAVGRGQPVATVRDGDLPPTSRPSPSERCDQSVTAPARNHLRAVHQFHSGTAIGDAITNAMFLTRDVLRGLGYASHLFAEHRAPGCEDEIFPLQALPRDHGYGLIVRHSMGHGALARILDLPVPKILLYHNITPAELLEDVPSMRDAAIQGREQLRALQASVSGALADSDYNALELRRAGFETVATCPLLFDVDQLLAKASSPKRGKVFTILFVGRLARSKGQLELVAAYARFRGQYRGESRLVLLGRNYDDAYADELFALIRRFKLDTGAVAVLGMVSDDERDRWYAQADLYVSLSRHEGFGVPLIEAMAHGVPVLAWPGGAVPYTLGGTAVLLESNLPANVAAQMLTLATDAAERSAIAGRQLQSLDRFRIDRHVPTLVAALARAGIQPPARAATEQALAANMRFTVIGHVNGSYSLAEANRSLAASLELSRPGTVRLVAVEGELTADVAGVPPGRRDVVMRLLSRPEPPTGPHVVISQHYPVWVPPQRGDLTLAWFFWEEGLVPAETVATLNAAFDGVLASSRTVAKALVDSGVAVPVRVLGHAPSLERFRALRDERGHGREVFSFLHVSSGFPRKGTEMLLDAYVAVFRRTDPVTLVIKTFPNPHNRVAEHVERLRADPAAPAIELVNADLDEATMLDLYRRADVMVLPTRGEGFNLPAAEALAAGLRLIVTGHGGHMDFLAGLPAGVVRLLAYRMAPADTHLSTPFSLWAEPDAADLRDALREAVLSGEGRLPDFSVETVPVAVRLSQVAAAMLQAPPQPEPTAAFMTTWNVACGIAGYSRQLLDAVPLVRTVLADRRTEAEGDAVVPCWTLGGGDFDALACAIVRSDPGIVVVQHQPGLVPWRGLAAIMALPALRGRVVCITLHNTRHLLEVERDEWEAAVAALALASRVVVHTLADVNRLAELGLRDIVTLIPQGVSAVDAGAAPKARDIASDGPVLIGCYGFFLPDKGILQLIEALAEIRQRFKQARLRLVNAAYPIAISAIEIAAARSLAAGLGVADAVEFVTDFLPEARSTELLAECDLVVLPYQRSSESSSAALRSAMAAQVPIAVTPLALFDEADEAVRRLPGTTPEALAEGVAAILTDVEARRLVAERAIDWRAHREWAVVGRRWEGMLRGLAGSQVVLGRDLGTHPVR